MTDNPTYSHLLRLFADNNKIESFLDLEGTDFIQNFDTLHLQRNLLRTVGFFRFVFFILESLCFSVLNRFQITFCRIHWIAIQKAVDFI